MVNYKVLSIMAFAIGLIGLAAVVVIFIASSGEIPVHYGVVIDAGSSHSGFTLYKWSGAKNQCTGQVEEVTSCEAKGGIADIDISEVGNTLRPCLETVSKKLKADLKGKTGMWMGATAGMRLLDLDNRDQATLILKEVETVLKESGLDAKQVSIISGEDEGRFSWVTTNYLTNNLVNDSSLNYTTLGMLDMGGASAQIAFESMDSHSSDHHDHEAEIIRLYGVNHTVQASSNLCFGVDEARIRGIFILITDSKAPEDHINHPCLPKGVNQTIAGHDLLYGRDAICLNTTSASTSIKNGANYTLTGTANAQECQSLADKMLDNTECTKLFRKCAEKHEKEIPSDVTFMALSSYYFTARVLNITENNTLSKDGFKIQSDIFCNSTVEEMKAYPNVDKRFVSNYCFQMKYIQSTLNIVYPFKTWDNIRFQNKVDDKSLGWSLGFMINATNAIPAENICTEKSTEAALEMVPFLLLVVICMVLVVFGVVFAIKHLKVIKRSQKEVYEPIQQQI